MENIEAFLKSCSAWLREDLSPGYEIEYFRQGTPPDEDYARAQEEPARSVSDANRRAEVQAWESIRN
jgi:hypothetical protein